MKQAFAILVTASILSIILFGVIFAVHDMDHDKMGCLNFALNGTDCPLNMLEFAFHHLESERTFFNANLTSPSSLLGLLALVLVALSAFLLRNAAPRSVFDALRLSNSFRRKRLDSHVRHKNILNWLSLLEHSPSSSV